MAGWRDVGAARRRRWCIICNLILGAGLGLLSACKSTSSLTASVDGSDCAGASLLERTLAVLHPSSLSSDQRQCLAQRFQDDLDAERRATKDVRANDSYDYGAMVAASSRLGDQIYSRDNVVDKRVYLGGQAIGSTYRKLIGAAGTEVLLSTFVWETESLIASEILSGLRDLQEKRRKSCPACPPVVVRLIANHGPIFMTHIAPYTGDHLPLDFGAVARAAVQKLSLDPKIIDIRVDSYVHKMFATNHAKLLVVDGQMAMITGANPQRFNDPAINWHDAAYLVAGEVARGLRTELINNLLRAQSGADHDGDGASAAALGVAYDRPFAQRPELLRLMAQPFSDAGGIPTLIASRHGLEMPSTSNNNTQNRAFQAVWHGAKKSIKVQSPNFNDDAAIRALGGAIRRGVKVELLLSKMFNCVDENKEGQGGQNEIGINRLLREFDSAAPQGPNHDLRWFAILKDGRPSIVYDNFKGIQPTDRPNNSHIKFASVDGEVVIVGSANMDTQSWNQSREVNLLVFHPQIVQAWSAQVFDPDFVLAQKVTTPELEKSALKCQLAP